MIITDKKVSGLELSLKEKSAIEIAILATFLHEIHKNLEMKRRRIFSVTFVM